MCHLQFPYLPAGDVRTHVDEHTSSMMVTILSEQTVAVDMKLCVGERVVEFSFCYCKYARNKSFRCLFLIVSNPSVGCISLLSLDEVDEKKESVNIGNWQLKQYQFSSVWEILWYSGVVIWMAAGRHFRCVHKSHSSHCSPFWFFLTGFSHTLHGYFQFLRAGPGLDCISPASRRKATHGLLMVPALFR